jgi:hypothetical protein
MNSGEKCELRNARGKDDKCVQVWMENLNRRDHLEGVDIEQKMKLEWILQE